MRWLAGLALCAAPLFAQRPCESVAVFSPCELVLELSEAEARQHPNPYLTVSAHAEFRSPRYKTALVPAYWDGGRRMVIRFAPDDAGKWVYRLTGNIAAATDRTGEFAATESGSPGFLRTANVHHWAYTGALKPHLWMGDLRRDFAYLPDEEFYRYLEERAARKFTHVRGLVMDAENTARQAFQSPDEPNVEHFQRLDRRVLALNERGITADLILAGARGALTRAFPTWAQRERYAKYLVARYASLNVTWQLVEDFETYPNGRALCRELGQLLKKLDYYQHPRTTGALKTSSPLASDGWMSYVLSTPADDQLASIEHQLLALPFVGSAPPPVDAAAARRRLWNATMSGLYAGNGDQPWFELFSNTRYWELEPYFDVEGGRAIALPDVEYIVYLEKPGPVEVTVVKRDYNVYWFDPATGESRKEKKEFNGTAFTGAPPSADRDWVLHLSRDGRKNGMLRSYRFESRANLMQEIEISSPKLPYELAAPAPGDISVAKPVPYAIKLTRESGGTRRMMYLITGEVARDGQGARVLASGKEGTLDIPREMFGELPAVLTMRVFGLNAAGKVYSLDTVRQLVP
jgi:hypothetical protein